MVRFESGCTGTHIGGGYVLTAGHCVKSIPGVRSTVSGAPPTAVFSFDVRRQEIETEGSDAAVITHAFDTARDYAVLSVPEIAAKPAIPAAYSFSGTDRSLLNGPVVKVTFLGLSRGRLAVTEDCQAIPRTFGNGQLMFLHTCDTEDGDSGAPLVIKVGSAPGGPLAVGGGDYTVLAIHAGYHGPEKINGVMGRYNYAFPVQQVAWTEQVCATETARNTPIPDNDGMVVLTAQGSSRLTKGFYFLEGDHPAPAELDIEVRDWTGAGTHLPVTSTVWSFSGQLESRGDSRLGIRVRDNKGHQKGTIKNATLAICP